MPKHHDKKTVSEFSDHKSEESSRGWFFTINNPTDEDERAIREDDCIFYIYQLEKGKSGTLHLQGVLYYKNARVRPIRKHKRAYLARLINLDKAVIYCSKLDTRVRGPYQKGRKPKQGERLDLLGIAKKIDEGESMKKLAFENKEEFIKNGKGFLLYKEWTSEHRTERPWVEWIWGKSGVGKTSSVYQRHGKENTYQKDNSKWWNCYDGQEAIIIDDFDGKWDFRNFLTLIDEYQYMGEIKNGYVKITSKFIYITCEFHPSHFWGRTAKRGFFGDLIEEGSDNELAQIVGRIDKITQLIGIDHRAAREPRIRNMSQLEIANGFPVEIGINPDFFNPGQPTASTLSNVLPTDR